MQLTRIVLSVCVSFLPSVSLAAQTATPSSQALLYLQGSLAALSGSQTLNDVTLSGTARRIAGSDYESGTAVFTALAAGAARTDISFSSGQRSEVCNLSATTPAGAWSGPDRISHPIVLHNLVSETAWFFPTFAIARRLSTSGFVTTYVGHETHNGQAVEHVSVSRTSSAQFPPGSPLLQHLTQVDFFLKSDTLLPAAIAFSIHPDDNALLDIPVEVQFSDYRPVSGTQVPYHIQKYLNNGLILDFQVQTVTLNSGLTAASFQVQ